MATSYLGSTQLEGTTALATIVPAPAAGKIRRVDLTACNITAPAAYAAADVYVLDGANSGYRKNGYPVPAPPDPDCAVILEYQYVLAAGQALQIRASADNAVAFSAEVFETDA